MTGEEATAALLRRTGGRLWLTDGGVETALIFLDGLDLPQFAAFPLLDDAAGRDKLTAYFNGFLDEAARQGTGFVLDTVTWRASGGWGAVMGLTEGEIARANRTAVAFAFGLKAARPAGAPDIVINGVVGPHGDAYAPDRVLTADEAEAYWGPQIAALAEGGAETITAATLSDPGQGIGIARAAQKVGLPVVIGYTVETDGRLVSGMDLAAAVAATDAATGCYPAWYMINCAHPDHFRGVLSGNWVGRIGAVRANASRRSHAELDEATELDAGDPEELGRDYRALLPLLPGLRVLGGCCGTDLRHVTAMGRACLGAHLGGHPGHAH